MLWWAHPRGKRQLAVAPVTEEEELRRAPRLVLAAESRNEIERKVGPRRRGPRRHQPVLHAGRHQNPLGTQTHLGIAKLDLVNRRPVAGGLFAVEQPRLRQHQRTGADRTDQRALRLLQTQPGRGRRPAAAGLLVAPDGKVPDDYDVRPFRLGKGQVGGDRQAREVAERRAILRDDARQEPAWAGRPACQQLPSGAHEGEDLVEAVEHPRRHLRDGDETDRDAMGRERRRHAPTMALSDRLRPVRASRRSPSLCD